MSPHNGGKGEFLNFLKNEKVGATPI